MAEYEVLAVESTIVKIVYKNLVYVIDTKDNSLLRLKSGSSRRINAEIPHVFPTGHSIDTLGFKCFLSEDKFNKIIISDGIQVEANAFEGACAHKVVWPGDCKVIPRECFVTSNIEEISNIQNVEEIKLSAFECSNIQELIWPSGCETIPEYCFYGCNLKRIVNLDSVKAINENAFYDSSVECLDFSKTENLYLAPSSLAGIPSYCEVIPSYYMDKSQLEIARQEVL